MGLTPKLILAAAIAKEQDPDRILALVRAEVICEMRDVIQTDPTFARRVLRGLPQPWLPWLVQGWALIPSGRRLCTRCRERTTTCRQRWCASCRRGSGPRPFPRPALAPKGVRLWLPREPGGR